jgi:hypothetical protein
MVPLDAARGPSINRSVGPAQGAVRGRIGQAEWPVLRQIVERERQGGGEGENIDDVGTAGHRYDTPLASRQAYNKHIRSRWKRRAQRQEGRISN